MSDPVIESGVSSNAPGKGLNIGLWVVQGLLAFAFIGAAAGKLMGKPEMIGLYDAIGIGHLFILHSAPTAPVVLLALTSFVLWGRRAELAKLLGRP
jgi:hypothetical protein